MDDPATIVMIVGVIVCFLCVVALILCCNWVRIENWCKQRKLQQKGHVDPEMPQFQEPPPSYDSAIELPVCQK